MIEVNIPPSKYRVTGDLVGAIHSVLGVVPVEMDANGNVRIDVPSLTAGQRSALKAAATNVLQLRSAPIDFDAL